MMKRWMVQLGAAIATNGYFKGFLDGKIYKGVSKSVCVPGLNCYSCPGALGSCPIGALQAVLGSMKYNFSYYVLGTLILYGTLLGRWICGWICPFGMIQDFLGKLRKKKFRLPKVFNYIKYVILIYFVILFPILFTNVIGMGNPGFCKYICPSGTILGAFPLLIKNPGLRAALGTLFSWKVGLLIFFLTMSVFFSRFFCRVVCPLGAIYGFFNKISLYRYKVNVSCSSCGICSKSCKMGIKPYVEPNSMECIRCGECISACPSSSIERDKIFKTKGLGEKNESF